MTVMRNSLLLESAITAFETALAHPALQPLLAAQRSAHEKLFWDLRVTLQRVTEAPDILVTASSILMGRRSAVSSPDFLGWLERFPDGVVWPMAMAQSVRNFLVASPMQLVIMIPMTADPRLLSVPREIAMALKCRPWAGRKMEFVGGRSAMLVGMSIDQNGHWAYDTVAALMMADAEDQLVTQPLPLLADAVGRRAAAGHSSMLDTAEAIMQEHVLADLQFVVGH